MRHRQAGARTPDTLWCRLRHRVGFRGVTLLWFACLDLIYGASLLAPPREAGQSSSIRWMASIVPLPVWGALWLAVAAVCAVYAFRRWDAPAFACAVTLKSLWGVLALAGWITGYVERGYLGAAVWFAFAGWVSLTARWPEPVRAR